MWALCYIKVAHIEYFTTSKDVWLLHTLQATHISWFFFEYHKTKSFVLLPQRTNSQFLEDKNLPLSWNTGKTLKDLIRVCCERSRSTRLHYCKACFAPALSLSLYFISLNYKRSWIQVNIENICYLFSNRMFYDVRRIGIWS